MSGNPLGYDLAGNVTLDNQNQYLYDAEGRVCASQPVSQGSPSGAVTGYVYDAEGNRVAKGMFSSWPSSCPAPTSDNGFTLTTTYVLGPGGEQVSELNGSGAWQHTNVYAGGALIATYAQEGGSQPLYFELSDWLGTKRVETDYAGNRCLNFTSLPYGDGMTSTPFTCLSPSSDATEHHFTGKVRDAETGFANGNDYFGARYFESTFGRFMTPDWSAKVEPVPYSKLDDPQTLNLYAYVRNNPISGVDLDGHWPDATPDKKDKTPNPRGSLQADGDRSGQNQEERTDKAQQLSVPASKRTYKTATQAATAGLDAIIGTSEKKGWEYGGRIAKLPNGRYVYTLPTTDRNGSSVDVDAGMRRGTRIPDGTTDAGIYHTHPASGCPSCAHEIFSGDDNAMAIGDHVPNFMESGATRSIYMDDPKGRTSILQPYTPTVIRYGPPQ